MDRLDRTLIGCGLWLVVAAVGCRSTKPEVPPGRPYTSDGRQVPPIEFSSDPRGTSGPGTSMLPGAPGSSQYGTPSPATAGNYGAPTGNAYGPPGTSIGSDPMPAGAGYPGAGSEPTSMPSSGLGAPSVGASPMPMPTPGPGTTGQVGQAPGPP